MKKIKLGEVLDVKRGPGLSGEFYAKSGDKIRLTLGNFNYPNGGFKKNTSKDDIYFTGNVKPEYILHKGDIITPLTEQVRGLLGSTATIPEDDLYIQNGDVALVIPNEKLLDKRFSYYLISSPIVKAQLDAGSQQTKIRHTSPDKIKDCIAIFPEDINIQKKIAKIADDINNKIEINNQINSELEALAKTLYDYWFLQFEFPNEEGKPYKSSGGKMVYNEQLKKEIPEGWEVKELLSFSYWESASQPPKSEFIYRQQEGYVRFVQNRDYESDANITYVPLRKHTKLCDEYDILIDKYGDKTSGTVRYGLNGAYNVALGKLTPTIKNSQEYIRYYLSTKNMFDYLHNACMASTRSSMNETVFKGIFVPIPINIVLENFEKFSKKIIDKKLSLKKENKELISLRDFLLPLLMNGQVTIQDAEQQVKNTISNVWNAEKLIRFAQWKQMQGYAARGDVDEDTLMKIFDAMDKDAKK